jgi:hypothetical protein
MSHEAIRNRTNYSDLFVRFRVAARLVSILTRILCY